MRRKIADRRLRELIAQIPVERHRPADRRRLQPARIGHLLVLVADLLRNLVVDGGEGRDGLADLPLLQRLADLLLDERRNRLRPGPRQQRVGARERMKRNIGRHRDQPKRGDGLSGPERGAERLLQLPDLPELVLGLGKDIFVDEALPR